MDHVTQLYDRCNAGKWGVLRDEFANALAGSVAHRFPSPPSAREQSQYLEALHLEDLALAIGCRLGHDAAWEHFIRDLRPSLYQAARTIAGDDGRELADSLYAELYGLPAADGTRRSLLAYYHGRSRLITWLRSVLVQRRIDRVRSTRRLTALDDIQEPAAMPASTSAAADPDRAQLVERAQAALDAAIDALAPRDRLRLRLYYGQDLTLARIGILTGEHEATVSRKLEKTRRAIRSDVESRLAAQGMPPEAVRQCFEYAASAPELQLDRLLARAEDG